MSRRLSICVVVLGGLTGCARQGIPEGGPRDTTPPRVIATSPDSGAVDVPIDAPLEIEFSESMNRNSVLDWVRLSPPRDFGERGWSGRRFRMEGGEDYRRNTTYTVIVGTGCRDAREGNTMAAPHQFVFSTGDKIDQGRIAGRLLPKGQQAHGTMVWAFDVELARARTDTILPDYLAEAGDDSTFAFLGLRTGRRYVIAAHFDANRDREFDSDREFLARYPDTLSITDDAPGIRGVEIDFRDPRAPGSIAGTVADLTGGEREEATEVESEAGARTQRMVAAELDTLLAAARDSIPAFTVTGVPIVEEGGLAVGDLTRLSTTLTDSLGAYELRNLEPGYWRVQAHLDQDGNERYDAGEPVSSPIDSVQVRPLETTEDVDLEVFAPTVGARTEGSGAEE